MQNKKKNHEVYPLGLSTNNIKNINKSLKVT